MKKEQTTKSVALEAESIFKSVIPYENGFTPNVASYLTRSDKDGKIIIAEFSWGSRIFNPSEEMWGLTIVKESDNGFIHDNKNSTLHDSHDDAMKAFLEM